MRACLVGYGMMGEWHCRSLARAGCMLHTLVGRRAEETEAFARRHAFSHWTTDFGAIGSGEVDLVVLANPSEQHAEFARRALERGVHVLVEIPLAMSFAEAEALVDLADRQGRLLGVVHPLRARTDLVALRERLASGSERLTMVNGRFFTHRLENVGATGYRRSWTDNLLWHHMAHLVDAAIWLADAPVRHVTSVVAPLDPRTGTTLEAAVIAETTTSIPLVATGSYSANDEIFDLMAVTELDSYRLDVRAGTVTSGRVTRAVEDEETNCARIVTDFVAAVNEGRGPHVSGRSVLPAMQILEQVQAVWDARHGPQGVPGRPRSSLR